MPRIVVLGAGFAGLWAAIGAARKREEIGARAAELEILVIDRNPYHNIRVRNYEVDLSAAAIPLDKLLDPVGVKHRACRSRDDRSREAASRRRGQQRSGDAGL